MADPEQIYQEVLQEEQRKGSAGPVAEGRAKAARVRAEHGSPHPKEPRWWPGAQPHLEGGDGAGPATEGAEPEVAEQQAAEAPVPASPEPPAAEAEPPAAQPAPAPAQPAPAPAQPAPAATPVPAEPAATPAPQPAAQPVAAAPAASASAPASAPTAAASAPSGAVAAPPAPSEPPPQQRPPGVTHGTATGSRLRPEDEVTTDAQFEGQRAVEARRKLIDELVGTGVPAVTAAQAGRPRAPYLAVLYLIIPLLVVGFLLSQREEAPATSGEPPAEQPSGGGDTGGGGDATLVAEGVAFDTDTISLPADQDVVVTLDNQDSLPHNFSVYADEAAADGQDDPLFQGENVDGGSSMDYEFTAPASGEYVFQCDLHPTMRGTATVE